ncbi:4Fe-4S binding protein [Paludibaculum fermentans]|uniref:4Fe-4S binding protein n=2 Tax=Paludibaculum fermentans TaxID=1473598 RepID=A0A7S7NXA0_PALFE|nr:4Fe-4S binding protein [Paludibaculum fermentans]
MAFAIGFQCIACGACHSTCPTGAIQRARPRFRIDPLLCTECVLFAGEPLCVTACPVRAIVELIPAPTTILNSTINGVTK